MSASRWRPPPGIGPTELLVVAMTGHYLGNGFVTDFTLPAEWGLDVRCRFTHDRDLADEADALWYHAPSLFEVPKRRRAGQKLILASMESEINYPLLGQPRGLSYFDLLMTYRLDSDIPMPYANRAQYPGLDHPAPTPEHHSGAPVLYLASNEEPARDRVVRDLMQHIAVDSPGNCLNNCAIPAFRDRNGDTREALRRYRFLLAFENSRAMDYVTEKAYRALDCGVVPVYLGAPNFRELMPADDAAIAVDDFDSVARLGDYLNRLVADPTGYAVHHRWRRQPLDDRFSKLLDLGDADCRYRMAVKLAHGCGPECACGGRYRDRRWP